MNVEHAKYPKQPIKYQVRAHSYGTNSHSITQVGLLLRWLHSNLGVREWRSFQLLVECFRQSLLFFHLNKTTTTNKCELITQHTEIVYIDVILNFILHFVLYI